MIGTNLPNLNEPRIGKSLANPNGVSVFFAVVRTAIENNKWARQDFDHVKTAEGLLNTLEDYYKNQTIFLTPPEAGSSLLGVSDPVIAPTITATEIPTVPGAVSAASEIPAAEQEKKN